MISLDKNSIKKLIPHRKPFLLIDRAYISEDFLSCVAYSSIDRIHYDYKEFSEEKAPSINKTLSPCCILEALLQSGALLASAMKYKRNKEPEVKIFSVLVGLISNVTFGKQELLLSDIKHEISIEQDLGNVFILKGKTFDKENRLTCECDRIILKIQS